MAGFALAALLLLCQPLAAQTSGADTVVVGSQNDALIKGALAWLAGQQAPNGSWSVGDKFHVAMTSYVLLAFMASGEIPDEGRYGKNVSAGAQFLLDSIQPDGIFRNTNYANAYMYSHGIATIALAEMYGQSRSPNLRPKLEKLVKVIIHAQNSQGGWRYQPTPPNDPDLSVTVPQVVALRAAKNAGFDVPKETIDKAVAFMRTCYDQRSGGFTYQPGNGQPGFARSAAGIYALQVCGLYDDPEVKTGSAFILAAKDRAYYTYGNYYAAPAEYMIGGESWRQWYAKVSTMLGQSAKRTGEEVYWEPQGVGDGNGVGNLYTTAVFTMALAMPYHYLPLYQR